MWNFIAAIFNIVANWFRAKKQEERQEIVETANEAGKVSAEITRQTEQKTQDETTQSQQRSEAAIAELHRTDSVRKQNRITADAVNSANDKLR